MTQTEWLARPLNSWMMGSGPDGDIVLSSRVRLARNLACIPFPNRADSMQMAEVVESMRPLSQLLAESDGQHYEFLELDKLLPLDRNVLVEKHIISPNHVQEPAYRALIAREDAGVSIMINEEDHLRLQVLIPGLNMEDAWSEANRLDDLLESQYDVAFAEELGYLTACPTNLGTGLRASVLIHLPALALTRQIGRIVAIATQLGLTVRGLYGEGTEAIGNMFQISNQLTMGYSEQEIIEKLIGVVKQVVDKERTARELLLSESCEMLADRLWRAYGVLRYARILSSQEALSLLSEVRLGIDLGLIKKTPATVFNEFLMTSQANCLQKLAGEVKMDKRARDRLRAERIRNKLEGGAQHV